MQSGHGKKKSMSGGAWRCKLFHRFTKLLSHHRKNIKYRFLPNLCLVSGGTRKPTRNYGD